MKDDFSVDPECNQSTRKSQTRGHSKIRGTKIKGLHCIPCPACPPDKSLMNVRAVGQEYYQRLICVTLTTSSAFRNEHRKTE